MEGRCVLALSPPLQSAAFADDVVLTNQNKPHGLELIPHKPEYNQHIRQLHQHFVITTADRLRISWWWCLRSSTSCSCGRTLLSSTTSLYHTRVQSQAIVQHPTHEQGVTRPCDRILHAASEFAICKKMYVPGIDAA